MDATTLLENLQSGIITPQKLVSDTISKLELENPKLNAATEILNVEAQVQLEDLRKGVLTGIPISIKECYAIGGKNITSGSKRMKPIHCNEDAAVVKKLKAAGVIVVARGNTSEFLLGRETDNLVFGTTNNALNNSLTAGGSSGGDASLVASGCVAFGIGTDIGGSCRYPAVFNGIVGFKPASGQIDKTGIFPSADNAFVESMNSPGALCKSVRDARLVYNTIGNKQLNKNNSTNNVQIFTASDFQVTIKDNSISKALEDSINFFKAHFTVKDISIPESGKLFTHFVTLMCGGFTDKIYEWSKTESGEKLTFFGELISRMRDKPTLSHEIFSMLIPFNIFKPSASKLEKTIEEVSKLREKYNSLLSEKGILILPTIGILAPKHRKLIPQYNKPGVVKIITPISFCNVLNLSCITIPSKKHLKNSSTNPPGIQLIAAEGNEELLLNIAELLEAHMN